MKIGGPKGPAPPGELPERIESSGKAGAGSFEKVLGQQGDVAAPAPAEGVNAISEVSARLKAGEVTREQAVELLIEAVIDNKAAAAPPAVRQRLQDALRNLVAEDPLLVEKVRRLAGDEA